MVKAHEVAARRRAAERTEKGRIISTGEGKDWIEREVRRGKEQGGMRRKWGVGCAFEWLGRSLRGRT